MSWLCSGKVKTVIQGRDGQPLTSTDKLVLLILADYFNEETGYAHPSVERLAHESLCNVRHLQKVLRKLERYGLLAIEQRVGQVSHYRLLPYQSIPDGTTGIMPPLPSGIQTPAIQDSQMAPKPQGALIEPQEKNPPTPLFNQTAVEARAKAFSRFWEAYPRKVSKQQAEKAWRKVTGKEVPAILAGLEAWKRDQQWQKEGGTYIPHAATFLNQRRWEDLPGEAPPAQQGAQPAARPVSRPRALVVPGPSYPCQVTCFAHGKPYLVYTQNKRDEPCPKCIAGQKANQAP